MFLKVVIQLEQVQLDIYIYIYIGVVKHAPIKFRSVFSGLKYVENVLYGSFSKIMQAFCMYILHLHRELSMEY